MKIDIYGTRELLMEHGKRIEEVLQRAVSQALDEHKRAGNMIASWSNEEVVFIEARNIAVDGLLAQGRI